MNCHCDERPCDKAECHGEQCPRWDSCKVVDELIHHERLYWQARALQQTVSDHDWSRSLTRGDVDAICRVRSSLGQLAGNLFALRQAFTAELQRLRGALVEDNRLMSGRAGKLLRKGKRFVVVAVDEPYFANVLHTIRDAEKEEGTWCDADEGWFSESMREWIGHIQDTETLRRVMSIQNLRLALQQTTEQRDTARFHFHCTECPQCLAACEDGGPHEDRVCDCGRRLLGGWKA